MPGAFADEPTLAFCKDDTQDAQARIAACSGLLAFGGLSAAKSLLKGL